MKWWKLVKTSHGGCKPTGRSRSRWIAIGFSSALLSGCYNYVPVELGAVPDGQDVRVYVTRQAQVDLVEFPIELGARLRGTLVQRNDETFTLRVPVAARQVGFHQTQLAQDVRIPTREILQIEQRQLNRTGTGLLIAGSAVAAAGIIHLIISDARNETRIPIDDPPEARVPLYFSIPWR